MTGDFFSVIGTAACNLPDAAQHAAAAAPLSRAIEIQRFRQPQYRSI
jgi:hypothetical protein